MNTIQDIPDDGSYVHVTDSQDVAETLDGIGKSDTTITGLFIKCGKDDYEEIYGYRDGPVPYKYKAVEKLF